VTFVGGVKTYSDPSYIFPGGQDPHPRIYAPATGNRHEEDLARRDCGLLKKTYQTVNLGTIQQYPSVASPSRRDAVFTIRPNDGKNQSLYFYKFLLQNRLHIK